VTVSLRNEVIRRFIGFSTALKNDRHLVSMQVATVLTKVM